MFCFFILSVLLLLVAAIAKTVWCSSVCSLSGLSKTVWMFDSTGCFIIRSSFGIPVTNFIYRIQLSLDGSESRRIQARCRGLANLISKRTVSDQTKTASCSRRNTRLLVRWAITLLDQSCESRLKRATSSELIVRSVLVAASVNMWIRYPTRLVDRSIIAGTVTSSSRMVIFHS